MTLPDFLIIGAMKCGTSTLQAQLAAQSGIFMTTPKEPNFFSDDDVFAKGMDWYGALFKDAKADDLKGEASTHYAKLPRHPDAAERLFAAAPEARLIYLMRHPVDRLVSHYIHEWTMGVARGDIDDVVAPDSEYIAYGQYFRQLTPYLERFGANRILPLFLERMRADPDGELQRAADFVGCATATWRRDLSAQNVSRDRIKRFPFYDLLVESAPATALRRALAPRAMRDWVKSRLQMRDRPTLSEAKRAAAEELFNEDLARLGALLGVSLTCANFVETVSARPLGWAE